MPKGPQPPKAINEKLIKGLASMVGIETEHQRKVKAHAKSMTKWREDVRRAKEQDKAAWTSMQSMASVRPTQNKQEKQAPRSTIPTISSPAPRTRLGPRMDYVRQRTEKAYHSL